MREMVKKQQAASPASTVSCGDPPRTCTVLKLGDGAETSPSIDDFISALRTWAANKLADGDQRNGRSTALLPARPPLNRRPSVEVLEDRGDESEFQNPRLPSQGVEPEAPEDLGPPLLALTALSESCKDVEFDEHKFDPLERKQVIKIEVPDPNVSFRATTSPDHHNPPPRRHFLTAPRRFVTQLSLCLECETVVDTGDLWTNHHCDQVDNSSSNNSKSASGQQVAAAPPTKAGSDHFTGMETTPPQETKQARGTPKQRRKSVIKWGRDSDSDNDSPASSATEEPPSSPSGTEAEIVNRTYHVCSECETVHKTAETLALHRRLRHHSDTYDGLPPPVLDGPYSPTRLSDEHTHEERSPAQRSPAQRSPAQRSPAQRSPDGPDEQCPLSVAKDFLKTTEAEADARWDHGISWTRCVECRQQFADVTLLHSHQEEHMQIVPLDRLMALASLIDVVAHFKQREQREELEWAAFKLNLSQ